MAVVAIIVGTDESQISQTRQALDDQSRPVGLVFKAADLDQVQSQLAQLGEADQQEPRWLWLLAAGMQPQPGALEAMLAVSESSPSAAWIAPKLVQAGHPRHIEQYGLTATSAWSPISPSSGEFDQAQHDHREDLLAADIFGSLLRLDSLEDTGLAQRGFGGAAASVVNDYRLAVTIRLNGQRVLGAPDARVMVQPGGTQFQRLTRLGRRKVQLQLLAGYRNPLLVLLGGLIAPILALFASLWLVLVKRPESIGASIGAGFWWFANGLRLVLHRPRISGDQRSGLRALSVLFASREDIQRSLRVGVEQPAAIAEANLESVEEESPGFVRAGGLWVMALLAGLSWQFWPRDIAVTGGGTLPLGDNLAQLFSHAGASFQQVGLGLAAPSDPFAWVLFAMGAVTFWAPSLSVTLLVFLAKALAFASAWRMLSLVSQRRGLLLIGALAYAFWPALTAAQHQARIGTLLALILLPLFVFTLARILQFGASPRRSVQTWTWVGTSALLAAVASAGAPSLTPLLAVLILLLAIYRFKRIGYLMWIPVPLLAIWVPLGWYLVAGQGHPLALLTDPGVPVNTARFTWLQLLLGTPSTGYYAQWLSWLPAVVLLVGLTGTFTRRALSAMWLWLALFAAVASAWLLNAVHFVQQLPTGSAQFQVNSNGSPYALIGLSGLVASVLLVLALDSAPAWWRRAGAVLAVLPVVALAGQFVITPALLSWDGGARNPALVLAQAAQNSSTRTLVLEPQTSATERQLVVATVVSGTGQNLQDLSVAYGSALSRLQHSDAGYARLSQLAANLVAANGTDIQSGLKMFAIDYVLIPNGPESAALGATLDTVSQLEPVGVTSFGRLYRVKAGVLSHRQTGWQWSVTKQVQVGVLSVFALLAIPTRRRQGSVHDEEELDAFAGEEGEGY